MFRRLPLVAITLLALGALGSAEALAKPKIAVLGLEVLNPGGGTLDPQTAVVAKEITEALRGRARPGSGKYELAPNSDKELVDEKLMNSCDTELPACMAPIGASVGASMMIYGRIHKEATNYVVDLVLLNITTKAHERNLKNQLLAVADATDNVKVGAWAKKEYGKLVDEASVGTAIVEVSNEGVEGGTVKVDGEEKGTIQSGRLPIPNLPEGKHRLVIEVGGYQRFEKDITVSPNDRTEVPVTLVKDASVPDWRKREISGTTSESSHQNIWRGMFVGGTLVAAIGGAYWGYSWNKMRNSASSITQQAIIDGVPTTSFSDADCNKAGHGSFWTDAGQQKAFNDACHYHTQTIYGIAGFGVGAVIMIGTFYSAWIKPQSDEAPKAASRDKARKAQFAFTPIIAPNGGGATLRIDW